MKRVEKILKALANKRRLAIVQYLKKNGEANVSEIARTIRLSFRSTSRHLAILSGAEITEKDQRSTEMFYRIASDLDPFARRILDAL